MLEPSGQIVRQVAPQRNLCPAAGLFVGGVQRQVGSRASEGHGSGREAGQFAAAEAGQTEGLVDQHPFPSEDLEPFPRLVPQLGVGFARVLPAADGHCVLKRPAASDFQQLHQFVFRHRPSLVPAVNGLVGLGHVAEGIRHHAFGLDRPVAEADQGFAVGVAGGRPHAVIGLPGQPSLKRLGNQVGKPRESAILGEPIEAKLHVANPLGCDASGFQMLHVGVDVLVQRNRLLAADGVFLARQQARPHEFSFPEQVTQNGICGIFISAAGGYALEKIMPIAEDGEVLA